MDAIDDLAALMREAESDRERFLERFAALCEVSFPQQARVTRRSKGWLKRVTEIEALALHFGTRIYGLRRSGHQIVADIAHEVRGVVISRRDVSVRDWITHLRGQIEEVAHAVGGEGAAAATLTDRQP